MEQGCKDIKHIFGKNLKFQRELRNITQEKFAEMIEVGPPALSKIECGKSYPKPETIEKIIKILNIKPHLLFIDNDSIDIDEAYKDMLKRIETLKRDEKLFRSAYDFVVSLTESI